MAREVSPASQFNGYPTPREAPNVPYSNVIKPNPALRGFPLVFGAYLISSLNFVSNYLWTNTGLNRLRSIKELGNYEARYDPTVILTSGNSQPNGQSIAAVEASGKDSKKNGHFGVSDYHSAYRSGKLTPTAVARALLALAASPEHKAAFLDIKESLVLDAAEQSTKRYHAGNPLGILDGVPVAVKDEVDMAGLKRSLGSRKDFSSASGDTSWCVLKWAEAGAIIIGKLNMHEIGLDTTGNNPFTGTPLNPYNSKYYPGGSSSGSSYAVSAGLFPFALGADGGGSIRIPSSFCGIYGLKPSHGRVSGAPTISLASSNGVYGPMAVNMTDLELAYRSMATPDPNHPSSALFASPDVPLASHRKVLGIYEPWFNRAEPAVLKACRDAVAFYKSHGYSVVDINIPFLPEGQLAHAMSILSEITAGMDHDFTSFTPANKIMLSVGAQTPATDFILAQKLRNVLMQHLAFLFQKYPGLIIVTPTTPITGWHISGGVADLKHGVNDTNISVRNMEYVWLANFTGCPALSLPVGFADPASGYGRIPIGFMGMGEWGAEDLLIDFGKLGEELGGTIEKPSNWVDVMKLAQKEMQGTGESSHDAAD